MSEAAPAGGAGAHRRVREPGGGVWSFVLLMLAFVVLAGAGAAAAWGQFKPGKMGPMVSIALSAVAVVLTAVALWSGRRRGPPGSRPG